MKFISRKQKQKAKIVHEIWKFHSRLVLTPSTFKYFPTEMMTVHGKGPQFSNSDYLWLHFFWKRQDPDLPAPVCPYANIVTLVFFLHDSTVACEKLMLLPWWPSQVLTYQCLYHGLISDFKGLCHLSASLFGWVPWVLVGVPCIVTVQGGLDQIFAGIKDFGLANLCRFIRVHSIIPY